MLVNRVERQRGFKVMFHTILGLWQTKMKNIRVLEMDLAPSQDRAQSRLKAKKKIIRILGMILGMFS